jgi:oligopeptide/dipeptide ABC transporter ATP-binding protein
MLLDVQDLRVEVPGFDTDGRATAPEVLRGAGFRVVKGRILGLVGEYRSGKTLLAAAMLGLLSPPARVVGGRALFEGQDLLRMGERDLARLRGARIGLAVQSGRDTLDPGMRIGAQLVRAQSVHRQMPRAEAVWRAETIMSSMGITEARASLDVWPHELPTGQLQRVVIAMALINEPQLLIADEPTGGLDITTQAQILDLMHLEVRRRRIGGLILTRDLGLVAQYCDDMAVMFGGLVVEQGPVAQVFTHPAHPFTRALLAGVPERLVLGGERAFSAMVPAPGQAPDGCVYRHRCDEATERCAAAPPLVGAGVHAARCHFARIAAA